MKTQIQQILLGLALLAGLNAPLATAFAQGTAFTYQGRFTDGGAPYTGSVEFQFTLWNAASAGSQVAATTPASVIVGVTNGLFTVPLDFGAGAFPGAERWVQIEARTAIGPFTLLTPRPKVTAAPYAITASNLTGTLPAAQLSGTLNSAQLGGTYSGALTLNNAANSFSGSGAGLTSLNASQLTSGTVAAARLSASVSLLGQSIESVEITDGTIVNADISATGAIADTKLATLTTAGKVANSATTATTTNTANAIVARDASGNFSAGTVSATAFSGPLNEPPVNVIPVLGMAWLKPGTFLMGSRTNEPGRGSDEGPQTVVTLTKGFWMGVHEVTQGEYLKVIGSNPSFFTGDTNRPVEQVSWNAATNYCRLLTTTERTAGRIPTNWVYRLPTEAEWEYACRAGARTTRFGYGDDIGGTALTNYAWFIVNSGNTTRPVEQKLANPWGLMDMHGNVWEWCQDYHGTTYPGGSVTDPTGPGAGINRVIRGGGWGNSAANCRSAQRLYGSPGYASSGLGFRVVLASGQP